MHRARATTTRTSSHLCPPPLPALPPRAQKQYTHVQSKIDSGLTVAKVQTISLRQYVRRRHEAFARVSPALLRALLREYDEENGLEKEDGGSGAAGPCIVTHGSQDDALYAKPFLVLDVREPSPSSSTTAPPRIAHTRLFPLAHLHQGKFSDEVRRYKNEEDTLIILYDEDERAGLAASMATQLVERGWENVYMLTGGIAAFRDVAPEYVEGGGKKGVGVETKDEETDTVGLSAFAVGTLPRGRGGGVGGKKGYPSSVVSNRSEKHWCGRSMASGHSTSTAVSVANSVIQRAQAKKGSY